jgi:hypothetical protein
MRQKVREVSVVRGNENGGTMNARFPPIQFLAPALLLVLLLTTCSGIKSKIGTATETPAGLHPIDIRAPKFFWLIQPWKEGKLATIDGWGRFAEISFVGAKGMRIKKLCNFPRMQLDRRLITWPEAGLIAASTGDMMHHLAAVDDGKTKTHIPFFTWGHLCHSAMLLDPYEGLVAYGYGHRNLNNTETKFFVYNYKEDKMVYESPPYFSISLGIVMDNRYTLGDQSHLVGGSKEATTIFYDWRNNEIVENDLTEAKNRYRLSILTQGPFRNINVTGRYAFGDNMSMETFKLTWDEDYSDVKIISLSYLIPEKGKSFVDFILSADGAWATCLVRGYRGLYDERLYKRAFFHLDERYPNGISIPIITEDYERSQWQYNAFVEHPVHGMCFAQEWYKEGKLYLRLYKMSEVLAEINRGLAGEQ